MFPRGMPLPVRGSSLSETSLAPLLIALDRFALDRRGHRQQRTVQRPAAELWNKIYAEALGRARSIRSDQRPYVNQVSGSVEPRGKGRPGVGAR